MYIKQDNVKIAQCLQDIPVNEMEVADQIILLNDSNNSYWVSDNLVTTYMLADTHSGLYYFEKSINSVKSGESDEYERITASLDNEINSSLYLKVKDELHLLGNGKKYDEMPFYDFSVKDDDDFSDEGDERLRIIHDYIFKANFNIPITFKLETASHSYCQFLNFKLDDENQIVFVFNYTIDINTRTFSRHSWIELHNKNFIVHDLSGYSYKNIKKALIDSKLFYDSQFEFLSELEYIVNFDMVDYLREKSEGKNDGLYKLAHQFSSHFSLFELQQLFEPIWKSEELQFYIYPRKLDGKEIGIYYWGNNENGSHEKQIDIDEVRERPELYDEWRIAKEVLYFGFGSDQGGVSPYDGKRYSKGQIDMKSGFIKTYEDTESIIYMYERGGYKKSNEKLIYFKIRNHFVAANKETDKQRLQDLEDRMQVLNELTES